ncbi:MAG: hypothetical protein IT181_03445, partial [Acidobacteria bacterium]|nr:hypothetical protein [Acidobacteriota bacterium]
MTRRVLTALVVTLSAAVAAQSPADLDGLRAAWQFKRDVTLPADAAGGFVAIALPPGLGARSQPGWRDLRLVDATGRETPFVVLDDAARSV